MSQGLKLLKIFHCYQVTLLIVWHYGVWLLPILKLSKSQTFFPIDFHPLFLVLFYACVFHRYELLTCQGERRAICTLETFSGLQGHMLATLLSMK